MGLIWEKWFDTFSKSAVDQTASEPDIQQMYYQVGTNPLTLDTVASEVLNPGGLTISLTSEGSVTKYGIKLPCLMVGATRTSSTRRITIFGRKPNDVIGF